MIASAQTLRLLRPVFPFVERGKFDGLTYGLGPAGYDLRLAEPICIAPARPRSFVLAGCLEHFTMPNFLLGVVHDKSTWARMGIAVQNTVIEPGWRGYLTIELSNHGPHELAFKRGTPICQVIFHMLDQPTDTVYQGKYYDQKIGPQPAIFENV